jgi:hypothetical protein
MSTHGRSTRDGREGRLTGRLIRSASSRLGELFMGSNDVSCFSRHRAGPGSGLCIGHSRNPAPPLTRGSRQPASDPACNSLVPRLRRRRGPSQEERAISKTKEPARFAAVPKLTIFLLRYHQPHSTRSRAELRHCLPCLPHSRPDNYPCRFTGLRFSCFADSSSECSAAFAASNCNSRAASLCVEVPADSMLLSQSAVSTGKIQ